MATEAASDVREQLIRGGLVLVTEDGATDLSVRRLAKAADRTTMCIYTHFGSRRGLIGAVYERAAGELLDRLGAAGPGFAEFATAYRTAADEDPGTYALLFEESLRSLELDPTVRAGLIAEVTRQLAERIQSDDDAERELAARTLWSTMHGLTAFRDAGDAETWQRDTFTPALEAVLSGFRAVPVR